MRRSNPDEDVAAELPFHAEMRATERNADRPLTTPVQIRGPATIDHIGDVLVGLPVANQSQRCGILNNSFTVADIKP